MHLETDIAEDAMQMTQCRDAAEALAQLFSCVDEARWNSLARPTAANMASLMFMLTTCLSPRSREAAPD